MIPEPSFSQDEISPWEVCSLESPFLFLDVREKWEFDKVQIKGAWHIPLKNLEDHFNDLPQDKRIIVYCHHGVRSLRACHLLREKGFDKVVNLRGGIHRWAQEIDPSMILY